MDHTYAVVKISGEDKDANVEDSGPSDAIPQPILG